MRLDCIWPCDARREVQRIGVAARAQPPHSRRAPFPNIRPQSLKCEWRRRCRSGGCPASSHCTGSNALIVPISKLPTSRLPRNLRIPQARWPCPIGEFSGPPENQPLEQEPVEVIDVDVAITRSRNIVVMLCVLLCVTHVQRGRPGSGCERSESGRGLAASTNIVPGALDSCAIEDVDTSVPKAAA